MSILSQIDGKHDIQKSILDKDTIDKALKVLNDRERSIMYYYSIGVDNTRIGKILNLTASRISQLVKGIKIKLRQYGKGVENE